MNDPLKLWNDLSRLVDQIENRSIKEFTVDMVYSASDIWERPASHDHHLPDEREAYGSLLHTVRVASLCKLIGDVVYVDSSTECGDAGDVLLSAAILHDIRKYGLLNLSDRLVPEHPALVRQFASEHSLTCKRFEEIMEVIESHMGRWSPKPIVLSVDASTALHLADCIVARWIEVMPRGSKENTID